MSTMTRITTTTVGVVLAGLLAAGAAPAAQAADSAGLAPGTSALDCGYDGYVNGYATYNHCGTGGVVIEVDHFFWKHTYACMPRGVYAIPQGNVSWAIIGAEADGHTCWWPQPISVVGP